MGRKPRGSVKAVDSVAVVSVSIVGAEAARRAEDGAKRLLWQLGGQRARPSELRSRHVFGGPQPASQDRSAGEATAPYEPGSFSPRSSIFPVCLPDVASSGRFNANATFSAFREDAQPRYCSSLTFSIQSTALPSSASWMAMWVMAIVGAAPCQCFSPGAKETTSPGRISSIGRPRAAPGPSPW